MRVEGKASPRSTFGSHLILFERRSEMRLKQNRGSKKQADDHLMSRTPPHDCSEMKFKHLYAVPFSCHNPTEIPLSVRAEL
jgi:hypothetical protein